MKRYLCRKIEDDIFLDGNLDKNIWNFAIEEDLLETSSCKNPCQKTNIRALWNTYYLYIGFSCQDDEINATMKNYNEPLYLEEVVEIFIDDNNDLKSYVEIEVNPLNTVFHFYILNDLSGNIQGFAKTQKSIETAVLRMDEKNFWSLEIAIPLKEFVTAKNIPPQRGDSWRINFYRIDRRKNGQDEYSAWSPTGKINFHMPEKFGELVFV